jgi:phage/plasmid-associated DNA primase
LLDVHTMNLLARQVSCFHGVRPKTLYDKSLEEVRALIKSDTWRDAIQELRKIIESGDAVLYKRKKEKLRSFTPCGTFAPSRKTVNLVQHNGIVQGDIDHLDDPALLADAKRKLCADPYTVYCFVSAGGKGLKCGLHIPPVTSNDAYKHAWQAAADYHRRTYGLHWDKAAKDIARLCFVSWDPQIYTNGQADAFPAPAYEPPKPSKPYVPPSTSLPYETRERHAQQKIRAAIAMIAEAKDGERHAARLRAGELLGGCVAGGILLSNSEAYDALAAAVENNTDHRTEALKDLRDAIEHGHAKPIVLAEEEEKYQAMREGHGRPKRQRKSGGQAGQARTPAMDDDTQGKGLGNQESGDDNTPASEGLPIPGDLDDNHDAHDVVAALLQRLKTLADVDAKRDAILDAMPLLTMLDTLAWTRLKPKLKAAVPDLSLQDLEKIRREQQRKAEAMTEVSVLGDTEGEMAMALAHDYHSDLLYDVTREVWMGYGDGFWKEVSDQLVTQKIVEFMDTKRDAKYKWNEVSGVAHLLRARLAQQMTMETPGLLPFENGVLDLRTMQLHTHSPDFHFLWQLPYAYDPTATCPATIQFLHEATSGVHEQVQVLRAYAKAIVTRRLDLQRYLEVIGVAGSGKGTYTRITQALVGMRNVFITELKHLEVNRFELGSIQGKVLLCVTDAERYGGSVNTLKAITGQDVVRIEEKFKKKREAMAPVMVLIAANEPIQSQDYTNALVRRRISLVFRYVPDTPKDLLSYQDGAWQGSLAQEIPGIMHWVLTMPDAEMEALLKHTTQYAPSLQIPWQEALIETNPLAEWADQALILEDGAKVKVGIAHKVDRSHAYQHEKDWLYPHYRRWMDDTGHQGGATARRFTGLLKDLLAQQLKLTYVEHVIGNKGSQFKGVRLRKDGDGAPLLITKTAPVMGVRSAVSLQSRTSDECEACEEYVQNLLRDTTSQVPQNGEGEAEGGNTVEGGEEGEGGRSYRGGSEGENTSLTSLAVSMRGNGSPEAGAPLTDLTPQAEQSLIERAKDTGTDAAPPTGCAHPEAERVDGAVTCLECGEDLSEAEKQSDVIPCAVCGGTDRWDDDGTPRCVTCWPAEKVSSQRKSRAQ